jgi:hypothetical protein
MQSYSPLGAYDHPQFTHPSTTAAAITTLVAPYCVGTSHYCIQVPYDSDSLQFIAETRGEHVAAAFTRPMPAGAHFRSQTPHVCSLF